MSDFRFSVPTPQQQGPLNTFGRTIPPPQPPPPQFGFSGMPNVAKPSQPHFQRPQSTRPQFHCFYVEDCYWDQGCAFEYPGSIPSQVLQPPNF